VRRPPVLNGTTGAAPLRGDAAGVLGNHDSRSAGGAAHPAVREYPPWDL